MAQRKDRGSPGVARLSDVIRAGVGGDSASNTNGQMDLYIFRNIQAEIGKH